MELISLRHIVNFWSHVNKKNISLLNIAKQSKIKRIVSLTLMGGGGVIISVLLLYIELRLNSDLDFILLLFIMTQLIGKSMCMYIYWFFECFTIQVG